MLSDIEIAQSCQMRPIAEVAAAAGLDADDLELYGKYKAKLSTDVWTKLEGHENGKLVLVTAINPTPAGEGKTTTTVGLGQAMAKLGKNAVIALREPSLGPVFGIKGGAAGGGYAQVVPMEDINLHFTGDMHAITAANNLLCAMLDNHMQQGNALGIDPRRVIFTRVMDMNDRSLRNITIGLGGKMNGVPREDHFMITVASEIMAILCLASDLDDLKKRFGDILVAYSYAGKPIFARDLHAEGAMTALMKDAIKPNLVQTLEGTPCLMHGGPFANIAHGCNSVQATKLALKRPTWPRSNAASAIWTRTWTTCRSSACRWLWPLIRSRPIPRRRSLSSARTVQSAACAWLSPRCSPRAARAARRLQTRCSPCWTRAKRTSICSTRTASRSRIRSAESPRRSTARWA